MQTDGTSWAPDVLHFERLQLNATNMHWLPPVAVTGLPATHRRCAAKRKRKVVTEPLLSTWHWAKYTLLLLFSHPDNVVPLDTLQIRRPTDIGSLIKLSAKLFKTPVKFLLSKQDIGKATNLASFVLLGTEVQLLTRGL